MRLRARFVGAFLILSSVVAAFATACGSDDDPEAGVKPSTTPDGALPETSPPPGPSDTGSPDVTRPSPTIQLSAHAGLTTCATKADHSIVCWGLSAYGALGRRTTAPFDPYPTAIPSLRASFVTMNAQNSCSLDQGNVWCWGGSLGSADPNDCQRNGIARGADGGTDGGPDPVPVAIEGATAITSIATGGCALVGSDVHCWGVAEHGIVGDHDAGGACSPPVVVLSNVKAIGGTFALVCAIKTDDSLWCWGRQGDVGELGRRTDAGVTPPVQLANVSDVRALAPGHFHMCVLKNDGTVWCWGSNEGPDRNLGGQLGHTEAERCSNGALCDPEPKQVIGLTDVREVSSGTTHTCAIKNDDTVVCWGASDGFGVLGHDPKDDRDGSADAVTPVPVATPMQVKGLTNVAHISAGFNHTCAVTRDDRVFCWGDNQYGQLGPNAGDGGASFTPIEVPLR